MDPTTTTASRGAKRARDPLAVQTTVITSADGLEAFAAAVANATVVAIDTETYDFCDEPGKRFGGHMRVLSAATRDRSGNEAAWVIDARDVDPTLLAPALTGVTAIGWNANFDSDVVDRAVFNITCGVSPLRWWDAMLADATVNQGRFGFKSYHGLATAAYLRLGIRMAGKGTTQTSFDGTSDLTDDQLAYAASDAVVTLWVYDAILAEVAAAGLTDKVAKVMAGRPFIDLMQRAGMPFDWDSWSEYLDGLKEEAEDLLGRLADLTGGGQGNLFTAHAAPSWNPESAADVQDILNQYAPDAVRKYFAMSTGRARLFERTDSTSKDVLKQIDSEIASTLLEYKSRQKVLSTYGSGIGKWVADDGRIHSQYVAEVGTDTGRLSSEKPNAQNWTPKAKKFMRTPDLDRVFVYADYSQAELRFLAALSGDEAMLAAFREGRDIHVATAERMFGVDMEALAKSDPKAHKAYRAKAKTLNFGIVYGLGAKALATRLTLVGVPCEPAEAKKLLAAYLETYPQVAEWLAKRDRFIRSLAQNPPQVDLAATLRMREIHSKVHAAAKALTHSTGALPTAAEIAADMYTRNEVVDALTAATGVTPSDEEVDAHFEVLAEEVDRARALDGAVVLGVDGAPLLFESRTPLGSRRQFEVGCDQLLLEMCFTSLRRMKPGPKMSEFCTNRGVEFHEPNGRLLSNEKLKKVFEDRALRRDWIEFLVSAKGPAFGDNLATQAYGQMVSALGNAYRNHPIQGGVADIGFAAYAALMDVLEEFPSAVPVQTVHDSITLECDRDEAVGLCMRMKSVMEKVFTHLCPGVTPKADADIRVSFDDSDVIVELPAAKRVAPDNDPSEARAAEEVGDAATGFSVKQKAQRALDEYFAQRTAA